MAKQPPSNVFARIAAGELPAEIVYQDDQCLAFRDIHPQAPVHILVIPRKPYASLADAAGDTALLGHMLQVLARMAEAEGLEKDGYRIVTNVGRNGGQTVHHLHMHLLGGRQMGWPPG